MAKIKFTGFATDSKTGNRGRVEGEFKANDVSRNKAVDASTSRLQRAGYKGIHIDDSTYES